MLICPGCGVDVADGAAFCSACGRRLTTPADRTTRRLVTVLFADLVGSTALGERIDPEALRGLMGSYFDGMRAVVERHLGVTERLIGDSVMAVFGARQAREDDALRAVRAAAEMRTALAELNHSLGGRWGTELEMRIGVNTGEVLTGAPHAAIALGDVLGDAVNVAARLQSAAAPGDILIGGLTRSLVRDWVTGEPLVVSAKGKSEPVQAFRLAQVTPAGEPPAPSEDPALIGRSAELSYLRSEFDAAIAGDGPRLIVVLGEAGVGKSRLVREFTRDLPAAAVLRSRCLSYGTALTYWPLAEIVRQAVDVAPDGSFHAAVRDLFANNGTSDADADTVAEMLEAALGLTAVSANPLDIAWACRQLLVALAAVGPRIVVIDDVQWADPTFVDLVKFVVGQQSGSALLVVCMARPELLERYPDWPERAIQLQPLESEAFEHLVGGLIPGDERAAALAERIARVAGGNPLFAEELVKALIEQGVLTRAGERWTVTSDVRELELPVTIDAILSARIDRLDFGERDVLEAAAVIGQTFRMDLIEALLPDMDTDALRGSMASLGQRELVRYDAEGAGSDDLRFQHLLIRDAAYRAIPKARRAKLHARLGAHLEPALEHAPELDEIVAHHFAQAHRYHLELGLPAARAEELGVRAAACYFAAGKRAVSRSERDVGPALLRNAVELLPVGHALRTSVLLEWGCAVAYGIEPRAGIDILTEAAEAARAQRDLKSEWRARLNIAMARTGTDPEGSTVALFAAADEAERLFAAVQDPTVLAEVWRARAAGHHMHSNETERVAALDRAIDYDSQAGVPNPWLRHVGDVAGAFVFGPTPAEEAMRRLRAMLENAAPAIALNLHPRCACIEAMLGHFDAAERHQALAASIADELGVRQRTSMSAAITADLMGEQDRAVSLLEEIARECEEVDDLSALAGVLGLLATQLVPLGRIDEAFAAIKRSDELTASDDHINFVWSRCALALAHLSRDEYAAAEVAAREAIDHAEQTDAVLDTGDAYLALARALAGQGRDTEAQSAAQRAHDIYTAKQVYARLPKVDRLTAALASTSGHRGL